MNTELCLPCSARAIESLLCAARMRASSSSTENGLVRYAERAKEALLGAVAYLSAGHVGKYLVYPLLFDINGHHLMPELREPYRRVAAEPSHAYKQNRFHSKYPRPAEPDDPLCERRKPPFAHINYSRPRFKTA